MRQGNWVSAILVFAVTLLLTVRLFRRMESMQEELNRERAEKAILVERERIARELHDGIAQSLFLLSVQMHKLEQPPSPEQAAQLQRIKKTIRRVHDDVRQAIANLRLTPSPNDAPWTQTIMAMIRGFENDTRIQVHFDCDLNQDNLEVLLTPKEKVEIFACLREALMNIRKHANAKHVWIRFANDPPGWRMKVEDDGEGFSGDPFGHQLRYGLRMMRERAEQMGWGFRFERDHGRTRLEIRKGVKQ
jgi:two-component system nitrate/nitrite sensor histidine kinase NarQ